MGEWEEGESKKEREFEHKASLQSLEGKEKRDDMS